MNSLRDDFKWNTLYTYIYVSTTYFHLRIIDGTTARLHFCHSWILNCLDSFSQQGVFLKSSFSFFFFFFNIPFFVVDIIRYVGNSKFGVQHIFYFIWNRISLHASNERYNAVSSNKAFTRSSILPRQ